MFLLAYVVDWVAYLFSIVRICRSSRRKSHEQHDRGHISTLCILSLLFAVAWAFGLAGTSRGVAPLPSEVTQYVFAVFITLHGVFTLILHTLRSPEAKEVWAKLWYVLTCKRGTYSPGSTTKSRYGDRGDRGDTELSSQPFERKGQMPSDEDMRKDPSIGGVVVNTYVSTGNGGGMTMVDNEEEAEAEIDAKEDLGAGNDAEEGVSTRL